MASDITSISSHMAASVSVSPTRSSQAAGNSAGKSEGDPGTKAAAKVGTDLPPTGASKSPDKKGLAHAVRQLNDFIQNDQRALEFSIDQQSGRTVIKVIDLKNKEVIRQIPPEEVLRLAESLAESERGTILKAKA